MTAATASMLLKAQAIQNQLTAWRRDFHMHPEIGFEVTRTAARVAELCDSFGCRVRSGVGRSGVIAELGQGSPILAIRADMDALPLQEQSGVDYASTIPGRMHACGHDAHMAAALGVALLLSQEKFPGMVRILFQPAEEVADEQGLSGAPRMIAEGAMEGVDMILALHVEPTTPTGAIRIESGPVSGGVDSWFGEIIGRGGHGANPHLTIDPFYLTAHVMLALNAIVSRRLYPFDPAVVSIGSLHGGHAENVIPERVSLTGTLRYLRKEVQAQVQDEIRRAFELARALGGDYALRFEIGTPPMINHAGAADHLAAVGRDLLGEENVWPWKRELGAEDFGCFLEHAPGAMFALGSGNPDLQRHLHSPDYDLDERCLPVGAAVLAEAALRFLRGRS
ncbi:MAG: amidohydrolase [Anaerolineales bacterium]|nr:amidohydrolase [Anaerolineales bacterium]